MENRNLFTNLDGYGFLLQAEKEGECLAAEVLEIRAEPGEIITVSIEEYLPSVSGEYVVTVAAVLKNGDGLLSAGHQAAFGQTTIGKWQPEKRGITEEETQQFKVVYGDVNIGVKGKGFSCMFSKGEGGIISLVYDGEEYITRTTTPFFLQSFYR